MAYLGVIETLRDPEVRNYFISILQSQLSPDKKLERFVAFFDLQGRLEERIAAIGREAKLDDPQRSAEIVSAAAQQLGVWQPDRILEKSERSVIRGVRRILSCQHKDRGWGYEPELSSVWGTAYAVMALRAAQELHLFTEDLSGRAEDGLLWIERWLAVEAVGAKQSTYDPAVAVGCLCRNGRARLPLVRRCLERLLKAQNVDGGWSWNFASKSSARQQPSEVGATAFILGALSVTGEERFRDAVKEGIKWLVSAQHEDGSWSEIDDHKRRPTFRKSINKTCDALNGINAGKQFELISECQANIDMGVSWILEQEKLVRYTTGWGYVDEEAGGLFKPDLVSTCIVLEILVRIESVSLPLISANALWLISSQHREPSTIEDGKWIGGDTFRITLALIDYFNKIKQSPLFRISAEE